MRTSLKTLGVAVILATVAIGSGSLVGFASTPLTGNIDIVQGASEPGNLTVDGSITTDSGQLIGKPFSSGAFVWNTIAFGNGTSPPEFLTNVGNANMDILKFGSGQDWVDLGPETGGIRFETTLFGGAYDDGITYTAGAGANDDELMVRSDDVVVKTNGGDVIVRLGN